MATAEVNDKTYTSSKIKTILTVCLIAGLLIFILFAGYCLRKKPHNAHEVIAVRISHTDSERQRHVISKTIVESIPLVRYSYLTHKPKLDIGADIEANVASSTEARDVVSLQLHQRPMKWIALSYIKLSIN